MKKLLRLKRLWLLLLFPCALLLLFLSARSSGFAEWYALHIYPALSAALNSFSSLFPFSLAEILLILAILFLFFSIILFLVNLIRLKEERTFRAGRFLTNLLCAASVLFFAYAAFCGTNYHRIPFSEICKLEVRPSSKEELTALCTELAQELSAIRRSLPEDGAGVLEPAFSSNREMADAARDSFHLLGEDFPTLSRNYGSPKPVLFSRAMSWANITGMFFPFTYEANVNVDIPQYMIPSTMCHELAHLRGYMREDEANFIAYLACRKSESEFFRYSGLLLAFVYANNSLHSTDPDLGSETFSLLDNGVKRDLVHNSQYWKQFEGPIAEVSSKANDAYLKANQQEDGIKSYGRMVDLLLADYRAREGLV